MPYVKFLCQHLSWIVVSLCLVLAAGTIEAQEITGISTDPEGESGLMGGGGEGGQFPEGTNNCSGDRHHHAHDYPTQACPRRVNPHYTTTLGGGEHCTARTKTLDSCTNCCSLQKEEALECHCFEDYCSSMQDYVQQKCNEDCIGREF